MGIELPGVGEGSWCMSGMCTDARLCAIEKFLVSSSGEVRLGNVFVDLSGRE